LGGQSLKAITLSQNIQKEFSIALLVKDFLDNATIRSISRYIVAQIENRTDFTSENEKEYFTIE